MIIYNKKSNKEDITWHRNQRGLSPLQTTGETFARQRRFTLKSGSSQLFNLKNEKVKTPVMAGKEVYSQETKFTRLFMKSASEESNRP